MTAIHTWTIEGDVPLTFTIHEPAVTIRCGDGPEVRLTPAQVAALHERFTNADELFHESANNLLD